MYYSKITRMTTTNIDPGDVFSVINTPPPPLIAGPRDIPTAIKISMPIKMLWASFSYGTRRTSSGREENQFFFSLYARI